MTSDNELVERIRSELFANLVHYRQRCINEADDAREVVKFIRSLPSEIRRDALEEQIMAIVEKAYSLGYCDRPGDSCWNDRQEALRTNVRSLIPTQDDGDGRG